MKRIPLTQGKFALVDDADYDWLNQQKWYAHKDHGGGWYVYRNGHAGTRRMHRVIMRAPAGMDVDHKNGDGLDNQRHNLRVCTHAENTRNQRKQQGSSRYKGVWWDKNNKRWIGGLMFNYKHVWLGRFDNEVDAAKAYDKKAKELFGEFAKLNFPIKVVTI